jgi:hypothetical protein
MLSIRATSNLRFGNSLSCNCVMFAPRYATPGVFLTPANAFKKNPSYLLIGICTYYRLAPIALTSRVRDISQGGECASKKAEADFSGKNGAAEVKLFSSVIEIDIRR